VPEAVGTRRLPTALNFSPADVATVQVRERTYITPTGGNEFTIGVNTAAASTFLQLDLPRDCYMDSNTVALSFDLEVGGFTAFDPAAPTTTTCCRFQHAATDIFSRLRLLQGSEELMDLENYNVWKALEAQWVVPITQQKISGAVCEGNAPISWAASVTTDPNLPSRPLAVGGAMTGTTNFFPFPGEKKEFNVLFTEGLFSVYRFLPLKRMQQLSIKINFESLARAFVWNKAFGGTEYYKISNVRLWFDKVILPDEVDQAVSEAILQSAISIHHPSWRSQTQAISNQNESPKFTERVASLKSIFIVGVQTSQLNDPVKWKFGNFSGMDWVDHQFRIDGVQYPPNKIQQISQVHRWAERAFGIYHVPWQPGKPVLAPVTSANFISMDNHLRYQEEPYLSSFTNNAAINTYTALTNPENTYTFYHSNMARNKWVLAYDFDLEDDPHAICGLNTANRQADIELVLSRSSSTPHQLYGFILHDVTLLIAPQGKAAIAR